jgi:hypothetical protein
MALEVKRKERESSQNLVRRFTKRMQQSGILKRARKTMFKQRVKSRMMTKRAALRREIKKEEYRKIQKLGRRE